MASSSRRTTRSRSRRQTRQRRRSRRLNRRRQSSSPESAASLQQSRDIKKNATGVVDAISAEQIGKFPDVNLAKSLQRIPGVTIERRNGEGNYVTVRGFGPQFNLVTVNGRQLATTDVKTVGGDQNVDFNQAEQPRLRSLQSVV